MIGKLMLLEHQDLVCPLRPSAKLSKGTPMRAFDKLRVSDSTSVHAGATDTDLPASSGDLANHQLKIVKTFRDFLP